MQNLRNGANSKPAGGVHFLNADQRGQLSQTPRGAGPIPVRLRQLLPRRVHGHSAQLLTTLPAVSVPSLIMVRRVFPAKVLAATVGAVIALGLLTAGTAALIGL